MEQLRDAPGIRAAQRFGYCTGTDGDGTENGEDPTLPPWLWQRCERSEQA